MKELHLPRVSALEHLSDLVHRCFLCSGALDDGTAALVISFAGTYRIGSEGNPDAAYMSAVVETVMDEWSPRSIILDLAELTYEWGDAIASVFYIPWRKRENARLLIVVSDRCRRALEGLFAGIGSTLQKMYGCADASQCVCNSVAAAIEKLQVVRFYSASDDFGWMSNFARYPIRLKGHTWPTVEHYFQAQKFAGTDQEHTIRQARTPEIAARLGRDRSLKLRRDWEAVKDGMMYEAVKAKFTQYADLRGLLLATGDANILEHTDRDDYWGDGGDGSGKNMLGRILMRVREELRARSAS